MAKYHTLEVVCVVVMLWMVALPPHAEAAISCYSVQRSLMPCLGYILAGGKGRVPGDCCRGIRALNNRVRTSDRRAACQCLKSAAGYLPGGANIINTAAKVPAKCGVRLPFKISSSIDCSRI